MKIPQKRKPTKLEKKAYEAIVSGKHHCGVYHKTCFHLHTPSSYDYRLLEDWDEKRYEEVTEDEILQLCIERHVIIPTVTVDDIKLEGFFCNFSSKKEVMSFLLLADSIVRAEIEIVLVADHNTVQGVDKLENALKWLREIKRIPIYPTIVLGVEISCGDRNHVVGMFPNTPGKQDEITEWINEHLISVDEGVYVTSIDALAFIYSAGGVGYLAHINTSDIFKSGMFSGGFKKRLLDVATLRFVGLSNAGELPRIETAIKTYRKGTVKFLLDNDSHSVDSVEHNCFWLKGGKLSYSMVIEALNDYDISVEFDLPAIPRQCIRGLYVKKTDESFLQNKDGGDFCVAFSNALNCLIGGRGTGKSSVLEMLEYVLSQKCSNERMLAFICKHGTAWVLYDLDGDEYLFEISMPRTQYADGNILECFGGPPYYKYHARHKFDKKEISCYAAKHYLHISKIIHEEDGWFVEPINHPEKIRDKFLDVKYSINELVNTASGEDINPFIQDTILKNNALTEIPNVPVLKSKHALVKLIADVESALQQRAGNVSQILLPFNQRMEDTLRVKYTQTKVNECPDFSILVFGDEGKKRWYKGKNIKETDIVSYLQNLYQLLGALDFFRVVANGDIMLAQRTLPLRQYATEMTIKMAEAGISSLSRNEEDEILQEIFAAIASPKTLPHIRDFLQGFVLSCEQFSLEFNVNNREGSTSQKIFNDVRDLSLGQKVIAMLTFVLGYSEYSEDFRPLIIDQPEDNLDNQYIYKNLVKQMRLLKEKRQVIIATHNATIVTNAKADLVCEMQSDHVRGWIESMGYPSEERIKKKILNHLEGGIDSFVHKIDIYQNVLPTARHD